MRDQQTRDAVEALIREVAATIVMPRYLGLHPADIVEKSPGELVTIADREAEIRLAEGFAVIDGEARILGEEACSANPSLLHGVGLGRFWLIDPIDGTSNFAAGRAPFGIMIALVQDGEAQAGWLYDPIHNRMCYAALNGGAFVNGTRVTARGTGAVVPIASLASQFMTEQQRTALHARAERAFDLVPIPRCAAEHYPRLCLGQNDIALFQRTLPWDHVPGVLFPKEAGGHAARWNGDPYIVADGGTGILAAASPALWAQAAKVLFGLTIRQAG